MNNAKYQDSRTGRMYQKRFSLFAKFLPSFRAVWIVKWYREGATLQGEPSFAESVLTYATIEGGICKSMLASDILFAGTDWSVIGCFSCFKTKRRKEKSFVRSFTCFNPKQGSKEAILTLLLTYSHKVRLSPFLLFSRPSKIRIVTNRIIIGSFLVWDQVQGGSFVHGWSSSIWYPKDELE